MKKNNLTQGEKHGGGTTSNSLKNRLLKITALLGLCMAVVCGAVFACSGWNRNADGYTNGGSPASIGSLTFSDYAGTNGAGRADGAVFDSVVLNKLYDKILGTTGTGTYEAVYNKVNASQSVIEKGNYSGGGTITQPHSMDYSALSGGPATGTTKTAPNPIILEFGGMKWAAVYLSTNTTMTTNGKPDLVLTLLAPENSTASYIFAEGHNGAGNTGGGYAENIYATSSIRVKVLNAGGDAGTKYAVSNQMGYNSNGDALYRTGTVKDTDRKANPYAQFTLSKNVIQKKSLTDYLVAPKYMELQKDEELYNLFGSNTPATLYNQLSEAWERGPVGGASHW
ncbi:MAG: hypothetical protein K2N74_02255, partial [Clostridiales bacterium]|nr:hypothetical protein [Clostridiales bacterium]